MSKVQRISIAVSIAAIAGLAVIAATQASTKKQASGSQICVLLPDTKSSVRWETQDRPRLAAAFKRLGDTVTIDNALGVASTQLSQAQQCLTNGAKVLLLVNLDSGSGAAIEKLAVKAHAQVVDYDRLTLKGYESYYVSFNNVSVGKLQGQGLVELPQGERCDQQAPGRRRAERLAHGQQRDAVRAGLQLDPEPALQERTLTKGPNQSVPRWDNAQALTIFQGMLTQTSNNIQGVLAANDGLGNAVVSALKSASLKPIPVTGQDATRAGCPEHPVRLAVHDRLQVDQGRGKCGRDRRRRHPARQADPDRSA